jgi:RNA polymerase sigma-70 factor (ECF subfamily)
MSAGTTFDSLIRRVRSRDAQAAADLVKQYERVVRLEVRMRLGDPRLRRVFDSMDVCQSVLASFFVRAAAGQFDIDRPDQLVRLLVGMARNKVAFTARTQRAQRRDNRRQQAYDPQVYEPAAAGASPAEAVAQADLLDQIRSRLNDEERQLADLRGQNYEWAEIAERVGGTAQGRRKQLARALDRVGKDLGLEELNHE